MLSAAQQAAEKRKKEVAACVTQQVNAVAQYSNNARQCLVNTRLIASLDYETYISKSNDPGNWGLLERAQPRWIITGTRASPVCHLPLKVDEQYESFAECARVNFCAIRAANCTVELMQKASNTLSCSRTATVCLGTNPIPPGNFTAGVPAGAKKPFYSSTNDGRGVDAARPSSGSGISGPSGRTGGLERSKGAQ